MTVVRQLTQSGTAPLTIHLKKKRMKSWQKHSRRRLLQKVHMQRLIKKKSRLEEEKTGTQTGIVRCERELPEWKKGSRSQAAKI